MKLEVEYPSENSVGRVQCPMLGEKVKTERAPYSCSNCAHSGGYEDENQVICRYSPERQRRLEYNNEPVFTNSFEK